MTSHSKTWNKTVWHSVTANVRLTFSWCTSFTSFREDKPEGLNNQSRKHNKQTNTLFTLRYCFFWCHRRTPGDKLWIPLRTSTGPWLHTVWWRCGWHPSWYRDANRRKTTSQGSLLLFSVFDFQCRFMKNDGIDCENRIQHCWLCRAYLSLVCDDVMSVHSACSLPSMPLAQFMI